jgi:hypothetical protein
LQRADAQDDNDHCRNCSCPRATATRQGECPSAHELPLPYAPSPCAMNCAACSCKHVSCCVRLRAYAGGSENHRRAGENESHDLQPKCYAAGFCTTPVVLPLSFDPV